MLGLKLNHVSKRGHLCCYVLCCGYTWWRHQMEHFLRYWPFARGIHRPPVNSPHKVQWRGVVMFSLICAWTIGCANQRDAGDLRRHCAHYDVAVMIIVSHGLIYPFFVGLFHWYWCSRMITYVHYSWDDRDHSSLVIIKKPIGPRPLYAIQSNGYTECICYVIQYKTESLFGVVVDEEKSAWDIWQCHYSDVMMSTMTSQITGVPIVCSTVGSDVDERKHQSSVSLAFVRGIQRSPVNSPHKRPATRKMFPFDDAIMIMMRIVYQSL